MFELTTVTHHNLEHGDPAGCAVSGGEETLAEAIKAACQTQEDVSYDGRGPKAVIISTADTGNGEEREAVFVHYGEWTAATSALCAGQITEMFNVGVSYHGWVYA